MLQDSIHFSFHSSLPSFQWALIEECITHSALTGVSAFYALANANLFDELPCRIARVGRLTLELIQCCLLIFKLQAVLSCRGAHRHVGGDWHGGDALLRLAAGQAHGARQGQARRARQNGQGALRHGARRHSLQSAVPQHHHCL